MLAVEWIEMASQDGPQRSGLTCRDGTGASPGTGDAVRTNHISVNTSTGNSFTLLWFLLIVRPDCQALALREN